MAVYDAVAYEDHTGAPGRRNVGEIQVILQREAKRV